MVDSVELIEKTCPDVACQFDSTLSNKLVDEWDKP
jgi:hypothetical protein